MNKKLEKGSRTTLATVLALITIFSFWVAPGSAGQEAPAPAASRFDVVPLSAKEIELRQPVLEKKIVSVHKRIQKMQAPPGSPEKAAWNTLALTLANLKSAYERLQTALKKNHSLSEEKALLTQKTSDTAVPLVAEQPPFNLSFYDRIWNALETIEQQRTNTALALSLSDGFLKDAREQLSDAHRQLRASQDQKSPDDQKEETDKGARAAMPETQAVLKAVLYQIETVNRQNLELRLTIENIQKKVLEQRLEWVGQRLQFDAADLDKQLQQFSKTQKDLRSRLEALKTGRENAEMSWLAAQQKMSQTGQAANDSVARVFVRERDAWRQTYQVVLEQTEARLRLLAHREDMWRLRYAIVQGRVTGTDLEERNQEIETHLRTVERILNLEQHYQTDLQAEILAVDNELTAIGLDPEVRPHLENQVKALRKLRERRVEYTTALISAQQLDRRLLDEIQNRIHKSSVSEKLITVKDRVKKIWGTEIWVIDNHAVTLRKLAVALLILVVGIVLIHYLLKVISRKMARVPYFRETTARSLEKVLTYVAYLLVVLFALRMVNIPLTAFAFLGGAIAIGVGFGAQNLINNFISGFIMMAERPISIGNLIELDGMVGQVEEIGARCTRVRTGENIHILVPNSAFLENNIINWSLSDHQIRTHVSVGVNYGSPVAMVEEKLLQAVAEHPQILKTPAPFVLFKDFGDNALIFEVFFWASVRRVLERRKIESQVRFSIETLFNEARIVIAFPQRDLHLDTTRPLELRLLDGDPDSSVPDPSQGP